MAIDFFENQRRVADRSYTRTAQYFYEMMQKIAKQLHQSTGALTVSGSGGTPGRILDLCMAPGGFLKMALEFNPDSSALAFSLPTSSGGHGVLLQPSSNVVVHHYACSGHGGDECTDRPSRCSKFLANCLFIQLYLRSCLVRWPSSSYSHQGFIPGSKRSS